MLACEAQRLLTSFKNSLSLEHTATANTAWVMLSLLERISSITFLFKASCNSQGNNDNNKNNNNIMYMQKELQWFKLGKQGWKGATVLPDPYYRLKIYSLFFLKIFF